MLITKTTQHPVLSRIIQAEQALLARAETKKVNERLCHSLAYDRYTRYSRVDNPGDHTETGEHYKAYCAPGSGRSKKLPAYVFN